MTNPMPRLALRPNPDSKYGWDLHLYDDGMLWTGWVRIPWGNFDLDGHPGVLTSDGERDLIKLLPLIGDRR